MQAEDKKKYLCCRLQPTVPKSNIQGGRTIPKPFVHGDKPAFRAFQ